MSGYTVLGLFCSFVVFLALPSAVISVEVNLKIGILSRVFHPTIDPAMLFLTTCESTFKREDFFSLQSRTLSVPESFLFVSTLDGTMHAVKKQTGEIRWSLKEGENFSGTIIIL